MKIIFTRPNKFSLFSHIVRVIEKSKFSHCAMLTVDPETFIPIVIHSDRYRVRAVSLSNFLKKNIIVEAINVDARLSPYEKRKFKSFAIESFGTGYGFLSILGILLCRIFKIKNIFADKTKTMACSEFIILGTNLKLDPEIDGPQAIYDELIKERRTI